jgi:sodium transport system permease protein
MTSASLEMLIAIFARNFKEAQNFISPLTIVVVIPALAILYVQEQTLRTLSLLPFVNSMLVIRNAVLDRVVVGDLALQLGSSFAYMIVALLLAARIFSSERAMFRS